MKLVLPRSLRALILGLFLSVFAVLPALADNHKHPLEGEWRGMATAYMIGKSAMHGDGKDDVMTARQTPLRIIITKINGDHVRGHVISEKTGMKTPLHGILHTDGRGMEYYALGGMARMRITGREEAYINYQGHADHNKGVAVVHVKKHR